MIELLVVITIVIILASLVFVGASRATKSAHSANDLNQMRELGVALASTAATDGRFPLSQVQGDDWAFWMDEVREGIGLHYEGSDYTPDDAKPFLAQRLKVNIPANTAGKTLRGLKHFAATEAVLPWRANKDGFHGVRVFAIRRPSELAMLVDGIPKDEDLKNCEINLWGSFRSRWYKGESWAAADNSSKRHTPIDSTECEERIDFRHNGKAHVLFVDGHIESLRSNEFTYGMFSNAY